MTMSASHQAKSKKIMTEKQKCSGMLLNKTIDWNQMSQLGLIERINREILHPLGLAMSRIVETGHSAKILISDDGEWEYHPDAVFGEIMSKTEMWDKLREWGVAVDGQEG